MSGQHGTVIVMMATTYPREIPDGFCARCGVQLGLTSVKDSRRLCLDCYRKERTRNDCLRCGGSKDRDATPRRTPLYCLLCAKILNLEPRRLRETARRERFGMELTERDETSLDDWDPRAVYHALDHIERGTADSLSHVWEEALARDAEAVRLVGYEEIVNGSASLVGNPMRSKEHELLTFLRLPYERRVRALLRFPNDNGRLDTLKMKMGDT